MADEYFLFVARIQECILLILFLLAFIFASAPIAMWKLYARLGKIEAHLTRFEQLQGTEKEGG
jgi:hypothetical protein